MNMYEFSGIITWDGDIVTSEEEKLENPKAVTVTDGIRTVIYRLNDSPSAASFYGLLPMEAEIQNYGTNEKIFYPPRQIDMADGIESGGGACMLAMFSPWGNVVLYYRLLDAYPGLYKVKLSWARSR